MHDVISAHHHTVDVIELAALVATEWIESGRAHTCPKRRNFLWCPPFFGFTSIITRFGGRFRDGQFC